MSTPQPNEPRNRRVARLAIPLITRAANEVFERELQKYLSQEEWEQLAVKVAKTSAVMLDADFDFSTEVCGGDVTDHKGNVNAATVIDALMSMSQGARKEKQKAWLTFLAQHFRKVFQDLHLLKSEESNGNRTQEASEAE